MPHIAPIALFVYNRPDHTRRTIKYLQKNLLADESRLFIFSDGAKTAQDESRVAEVRALINDVSGFKSVKIVERERNLGLADSIIAGVTQLVNEYNKVIVFEDDLLSSPYTLQYFNDALNFYKGNEKVMHIGAYMYPLADRTLKPAFFFRAATSWGWATTAQAWKFFEPDIDQLMTKFDQKMISAFSIEGCMNYWKQMNEFKAGKNDSWAIRWYASMFLKGGLALNPSRSLIQNIGHDGSGVHSNLEDIYSVQMVREPVTWFPESVSEDQQAYRAIRHYFKNRKGTLWQRGLRYIKQLRLKYTKAK